MKLLVLGRKTLAIIVGIAVAGSAAGICAGVYARTAAQTAAMTVVVDAGHGGIDAGVCGVNTGVKESDINLAIARLVRGQFVAAGFKCVMTRTGAGGLYGSTAKGFKARDMRKRKSIIEECAADMVISIHQNTCPLSSRRGAHVFFNGQNDGSKQLAECMQTCLNQAYGGGNDNGTLAGDYYMLKCSGAPAVIVECGFLSNAEDEKLLCDGTFRQTIALAIFKGAIMYLS